MVEPLHDDPGRRDQRARRRREPWTPTPRRRSAAVDAALHGERLDKALVALAPEFSRSHLQPLIAGGPVQVDGAVVDAAVAPR